MSKKRILLVKNLEPICARKETDDIDIFITYRNGNRELRQHIGIMIGFFTRMRKWKQFIQFK